MNKNSIMKALSEENGTPLLKEKMEENVYKWLAI